MSAPDVPTIDQMQATYDSFCDAVDREDTLGATIYATVCADHVAKLLKQKPLLIAAPDLLAVVREFAAAFNGGEIEAADWPLMNKAMAAIEKAEGR